MKVKIEKSDIKGTVKIPSSKSMTIRTLMCAALSQGNSKVINPLVCEDTQSAVDALKKIGTEIAQEKDVWKVTGGKFRVPNEPVYCGESATTMRFMTAIMALLPGKHKITAGPMLSKRPIRPLIEALKKLGVKASTATKTTPPVTIEGGNLQGGYTEIEGNISSQFISALLMVSPFAKKEVQIVMTTPLTSKPYVLMTLWCMKKFGINVISEINRFFIKRQKYQPAELPVEGDWTSASYFLALGRFRRRGSGWKMSARPAFRATASCWTTCATWAPW